MKANCSLSLSTASVPKRLLHHINSIPKSQKQNLRFGKTGVSLVFVSVVLFQNVSWHDMQTKNFQQLQPECQHVGLHVHYRNYSQTAKSPKRVHITSTESTSSNNAHQSNMTKTDQRTETEKDRTPSRKTEKLQQTIQTGQQKYSRSTSADSQQKNSTK